MAPTQPFRPRAKKGPQKEVHKEPSKSRTDHSRSTRNNDSSAHDNRTVASRSPDRHERKADQRMESQGNGADSIDGASSCGSDLDLEKPLYAIGDYLNDRKELVAQMFNSIKKDTLLRMIPPVLREFSLKELQEKCAFELEGFSRKRARAVLNGLDMISSSGTDDSDEEVQNEDQNQLVNLEIMEESPVPALKEYVAPLALSRQNLDSGEIIMDLSGEPVVSELNKDSCLTTVEPLEMELVELELRAQAIRALMQQLDEDDLSLPAPRHRRSDSLRSSASPQSNPDDLLSTELCSMISSDVRKSSRGEKEYFQIHADEEELAEFD